MAHPAASLREPPIEPGPEDPGSRGSNAIAIALGVLAVCGATVTLQFAAPVLMPVVLAFFLFYALDPIVDRLERLKVPRLLASVAVVLTLLGGLSASTIALWPQVDAIIAQVPDGAARIRLLFRQQKTDPRASTLKNVQEAAKAIDSAAAEAAVPDRATPGVQKVEVQQPWRASDWIWTGSIGAMGLAGQALTILFLTIFLLNENDSFKRKLVKRRETMGEKRDTVEMLNEIAAQMERFIWVQALTSGIVALATALALWWLGLKQPIVWGLVAGIMNIVPYYGPLIVTTVLAAVGFLQFGSMWHAAWVAGVALAITSLEGFVLTPHLLSRAGSLNPVAIFFAITFWSWTWGAVGMLLAVPLLMVAKAVCDHIESLQGFGEFLSDG
jgi:predicted PurR-regulated permease PerM